MAEKVIIKIECANAAFEPNPEQQVASLLREYADRIEREGRAFGSRRLLDINGNSVGSVRWSKASGKPQGQPLKRP